MKEINWFGALPTQNRAEIVKKRLAISPEDRESMSRYGWEYFDASNPWGYGGYHYDGRFGPVVERMIRHYHLDATSRVLDVGCAKGYLLYELHRRGIPGVYGIDISEYGIANTPKEVRPQCFVGSAHDLSRWPDGYFDLVICKDMLHNLPPDDADQAIREINRVGRGGKFIQPNSYVTEHQRRCLMAWVITIKTVRSTKEWLEKFAKLGYDGDYSFLVHDYQLE